VLDLRDFGEQRIPELRQFRAFNSIQFPDEHGADLRSGKEN
jgi:hypothetical protein